jgi:histidinol-phosphate/aromatic aminotransferase/cobyric acid decarboxylase-like protein
MGDERCTAHGGLLLDELGALGIRVDEVLDASVNVNPYGPCSTVRRAVAQAAIDRYPEPRANAARRALAGWMKVDPARVVVGNGAVDLLWSLARAVLGPRDRVGIVEPAFSEMRAAATRAGAEVLEHRTRVTDDFVLDFEALDAFLHETRPQLLYIGSPSNPAGICSPLRAVEKVAEQYPDTLCVADISFLSLSTRHDDGKVPLSSRVVWVRSLTKDHALAGLRVGFAIAPEDVAARLEAERPPWSVNALAQAAAIAAATEDAQRFVDESRDRLLYDRMRLEEGLARLGVRSHPSDTVFTLAHLGPGVSATELRRRLLTRHRVLVRDATSFGLPHHIRIAARSGRDFDRLVTALGRELEK